MGTLNFTVKQKKKIKFKFSKKTLIYCLLALCTLISYISCFLIIELNKNYLQTLFLPKVRLNFVLFHLFCGIVLALSVLSFMFAIKYDNEPKKVAVPIFFILALNIIVALLFFVFHTLTLSFLLLVSSFVLSCFYIKQLRQSSVEIYLFLPYLFFYLFILIYVYLIYLLN